MAGGNSLFEGVLDKAFARYAAKLKLFFGSSAIVDTTGLAIAGTVGGELDGFFFVAVVVVVVLKVEARAMDVDGWV